MHSALRRKFNRTSKISVPPRKFLSSKAVTIPSKPRKSWACHKSRSTKPRWMKSLVGPERSSHKRHIRHKRSKDNNYTLFCFVLFCGCSCLCGGRGTEAIELPYLLAG